MLGSLNLPLRKNRFYTVFGGPFKERTAVYKGVNLAAEINRPADVRLPIEDFSVPDVAATDMALLVIVKLILSGAPVYVGCMGGRGRTGLFLSILAKAFGVPSPVAYVRYHYFEHAVETEEQYRFVTDYVIPASVKRELRRAWWLTLLSRRVSLTDVPGLNSKVTAA